jgi:hypothetical protein
MPKPYTFEMLMLAKRIAAEDYEAIPELWVLLFMSPFPTDRHLPDVVKEIVDEINTRMPPADEPAPKPKTSPSGNEFLQFMDAISDFIGKKPPKA